MLMWSIIGIVFAMIFGRAGNVQDIMAWAALWPALTVWEIGFRGDLPIIILLIALFIVATIMGCKAVWF